MHRTTNTTELVAKQLRSSKSVRWLPKSRRNSDDCSDPYLGQDHHNDLKVNGIPDWENPMASAASIDASMTSLSLVNSESYVKDVNSPSKSLQKQSNATTKKIVRQVSPKSSSPPTRENLICASRNKSSESLNRPLAHVTPKEYDDYEEYDGVPNFENMVIECDSSNSSFGELTIDESVLFDEEYLRQNRTPSLSSARAIRSKLNNYGKGTARATRRPAPVNRASSYPQQAPENPRRISVEPGSPSRSIEDEEQRLIEMAMERSLQDVSYNGSTMSISRKSTTSEISRQSRTSIAPATQRPSNSSFGSSGCHLSMVGNRSSSGRSNVPSMGGPPSEAGPNFVWKREEKKWLKIPVSNCMSHDALHAIEEEMAENCHQPSNGRSSRRLKSGADNKEDTRLERMEQNMLEEAMRQSMSSLDYHPPRQSLHDSFVRSTNTILALSDDDDGDDFNHADEIDQAAALRRLRELEEEKILLERAVLRRGSSSGGMPNRHKSFRCNRTPDMNNNTNNNVTSESRKQKGLDRSVSARSSDHYEYKPSGGDNKLSLGADEDLSSSQGLKLVWKRGPNGAWGRFPEDDGNESNLEGEDRLVAEALRRSMEEM